jgi:hypothetical protein
LKFKKVMHRYDEPLPFEESCIPSEPLVDDMEESGCAPTQNSWPTYIGIHPSADSGALNASAPGAKGINGKLAGTEVSSKITEIRSDA